MISRFIADTMIKPHQSPLFDDPGAYGLDYEDVTFQAADGVTLSGWLIKGSKDKVIIQSPGVMCCRAGYTPEGRGFMSPYPDAIGSPTGEVPQRGRLHRLDVRLPQPWRERPGHHSLGDLGPRGEQRHRRRG